MRFCIVRQQFCVINITGVNYDHDRMHNENVDIPIGVVVNKTVVHVVYQHGIAFKVITFAATHENTNFCRNKTEQHFALV